MQIDIVPGDNARAKVLWQNRAAISQTPPFRWDLRKEGFLATWKEGPVIVASEVGPGLQGEVDVYCPVPFDWTGTKIDAKLMVIGLEGAQWEQNDVYQTEALPGEYEEIQHTIYPYAYIYDGDVEVTTATFKTDPFTSSAWLGQEFASKLEEEVRARGGRPIAVKVYVDTSPLFWTDFRIEVTSTPISGTAGIAAIAVIPIWASILIIALAIVAVIVVITLAIKTIVGLFQRNPGLDQVKPGWGKETLIQTITDSEEYWERPPTSTETLEGMSEPDLRHYLNQIADEEVPSAVSWWPLVIVGGLAVVGVGGAVALATRGKK